MRKEFVGPDAASRLRNEVTLLRRLAQVDGVPRLIDVEERAHAFLMADCDGRPLADTARSGPVDVAVLVPLAQALAGVLAAVHRHGIVHKDINPTNILLVDGRPLVIDFAFAQAFTEEQPEFPHHGAIGGTPAYLAPEQTGRMGRPVDHRADLYSLGATLYELAVGTPPFGRALDDPLALIHAHLAQRPVEPIRLNRAVPPQLSAIIMRLLEKEPDGRYQSAEGLCYDLAQLSVRLGDPRAQAEDFPLGTRDFPHRLVAPTQLVGRASETAVLRDAFSGMCRGGPRGVFLAGAPGVGKTALLDELRLIAASADGWFISTKLDPYRQEHEADAVVQGLGQLCRLLLAEPEEQLTAIRERTVAALGPNAGLLAHSIPELASLLRVTPEPPQGDPGRTRTRIYRATVALLGAVASPSRPVVFVVDDLQWAAEFSIGVLDAVLSERELSGVLLAGTYRAGEVDLTHPLAAMLAAWERRGEVAAQISLQNLQPDDLALLLGRMLRLDPADATPLAQVIGDRTGGNPFDTVELVNALRQEGVLVCGPDGWSWEPVAIRQFVSSNDVIDLLQTRIKRLPALSRRLVRVLTCLGGQAGLDLLAEADQLDPLSAVEGLGPAIEDGLVVVRGTGLRSGRAEVRFRHDRVREAVESLEEPASRRRVHLQVARLLAPVAAHAGVAAEQYLFAAGQVEDPAECRLVAELFLGAAEADRLANGRAAISFLSAARDILTRAAPGDTDPLAGRVRHAQHAVLCSLGRHDEADELFAEIERCCPHDLELAESVCLQIGSLTSRSRAPEAVALGLGMLRRLRCDVPDRKNLIPQLGRPTEDLRSWLAEAGRADDACRAELADPTLGAAAKVIDALMAPAYFSNPEIMAWLVIQAARMWSRHGPCAALVGSITHAAFIPLDGPADRQTVYDLTRHVLTVSEVRGYEPATSLARWRYSVLLPWYQQVEDAVHEAKLAREGLIRGGELQHACFTFTATVQSLIDCATDLAALDAVTAAGIEFSARAGNRVARSYLRAYQLFARAMRTEAGRPDSPPDDSSDLTEHLAQLTDDPIATGQAMLLRALESALLGSLAELDEASAAALDALQFDPAAYGNALARLLRALSIADRLRTGPGDDPRLLAELDRCRDWLSARCSEAPANFAHVLDLVTAERAWAVGDHWAALQSFESALRAVSRRPRPWYQALITERAARCYLAVGLERAGLSLMAQARQLYERWGATAKVRHLEERFPGLSAQGSHYLRSRPSSSSHELAAEAIDLLAIVRASQALSMETNLPRLQSRVAEVLTSMTGATGVQIGLRPEDTSDWLVTVATVDDGTYRDPASSQTLIPWGEAGRRGLLALSVFRYVERTRAVLIVDDVQADERLAHDPYFAGHPHSSLLAVPVMNQEVLRAMLILENRLSRGAFTAERLDAVQLIVGQLAVSLDNALLYRSLEAKIASRTRDLETTKRQLEVLSLTDPLTLVANRRRFEQQLALEWADLARSQRPLAIIMIDIDYFKLFNDALGHLAGDHCIRRVAKALSEVTRAHDLVARYGGEEFAVILPEANTDTASRVAERLRAAVTALAIAHPTGGTVSISLGIAATVPRSDLRAETLVEAADVALYRAKQNGRNRIEANE